MKINLLCVIVMFAAVLAFCGRAMASTEAQLKERFKQRYAQVQQFKTQGTLGETFDGRLDAPKPESVPANAKQLMAQENADRAELYGIIARQTGATPDQVAARNGARNFEKARPGEWLRYSDGSWKQKK